MARSINIKYSSSLSLDVILLIGCNVVIFCVISLISFLLKSNYINDITQHMGLSDSIVGLVGRPWTIITYSITQYSFFHLLMNMVCLGFFGNIWSKICDISIYIPYLIGAVLGGGFYILYGSHINGSILIGSSASIISIITAEIFIAPLYRLSVGKIRLIVMATPIIILSISGLIQSDGSISSHIGGIVAGLIVALIYLIKTRLIKKNPSNSLEVENIEEKIRTSGFNSLTIDEKTKLLHISESNT